MILTGTHDPALVILSILIAMFASFTALRLAAHVREANGPTRWVWLGAAAFALGGGIWSMHFVAMLAFRIPGMAMSFDPALTVLSFLIAVAFTAAGFATISWDHPSGRELARAGFLMGSGVVVMHYMGMGAMRMPVSITYDPLWLLASVLIAISAAIVALWLAVLDHSIGRQMMAGSVMGLAIAGMHYTGMHAATFRMLGHEVGATASVGVSPPLVAALISGTTFFILLLAIGAASLRRLLLGVARREARIALRLKIADVLSEGETIDALNAVVALTGEHFGVARAGYALLDPQRGEFGYETCWTDGTVAPLLGRYPASAFGGMIVKELAAGRIVAVEDLLNDPMSDDLTRETARTVATRSVLVVPFMRHGRLQSIVYLNARAPRAWIADDIDFMKEIAERTRLVGERASIEQQLRDLNATLEARVEARTAELRQVQETLLQSQKMEAVGQLVAGLAHDFNNVLGAMVGGFGLILRRADQPERIRYFAEAGLQAGERGAKLTAQLLAFSRAQRIEFRPLFVQDLIKSVADLIDRTVGPMIKVEFELDRSRIPVIADPTQVEMMMLNLAINARDAMPDGGTLSITAAVRSIQGDHEIADGDYVEISVRDNGVGMGEETLRRAVEPFFTTKPLGKGTGLGLAQIYASARQAGGTLRMESCLGQGTTVRVLLAVTDRQPDTDSVNTCAPDPSSPGTFRILLVDDDPDVRNMMASALEAQGHSVVLSQDGPTAIALLAKEKVDAAVIDFAMPGMNGAELARRIAQDLPNLPILFASGFADTQAIDAVMGKKTPILKKPFRIEELLQAIQSMIAREEAPDSLSLTVNAPS